MKLWKISVAAVLSAALVTTLSVAPASATGNDPLVQPTAEAIEQAVLNAQDATSGWEQLPEGQTQSLVTSNADSLTTESGLALEPARAQGWKIDMTSMLVRVPVAEGQGVVAPSSVTLFLSGSGQVSSVVESTFAPTSETTGVVKAWVNGSLQVDQHVGEPVVSDAPTVTPMATPGSGKWWQALNRCLAGMGVPAWILAGLSIVCAVACAATAGVGCIICIAAAAGLFSGFVGSCVHYANRA